MTSGNITSSAWRPDQLERPVLREELDVGDPAVVLLQVELAIGRPRPAPRACARACRARPRAGCRVARPARSSSMRSASKRSRSAGGPATARARSSAWCSQVQASLRWYCSKPDDALRQQPALAARPQTRVHLVEPAGGGMHGEQMHEALHEPQEEHAVLDDGRTRRALDIAGRVVEEHEIQVGPVAQARSRRTCRRRRRSGRPARGPASPLRSG